MEYTNDDNWFVQIMEEDDDGPLSIMVFSDYFAVCDVIIDNGDRKTAEANARLIAAAPEMYEALKKALQIIEAEKESCGIYQAHIDLIKSAIAKAEKQ